MNVFSCFVIFTIKALLKPETRHSYTPAPSAFSLLTRTTKSILAA
ncbi:hypothetical protein ASAP_2082 [Asaia bogorensis]|uniref:Uncharacterized protein n=1 Tax=Asaia bogorensis TaxID=91915 RepID=A0A060QL96_9PROT|nr:hypothetical protein ASAP_2082 [Asaia bogorensis]